MSKRVKELSELSSLENHTPVGKTPSFTKKDLKLVDKGFLTEDLMMSILYGLNARRYEVRDGCDVRMTDVPDYDMVLQYAKFYAEILGWTVRVGNTGGTQVNVGVSVGEEKVVKLVQEFFAKNSISKNLAGGAQPLGDTSVDSGTVDTVGGRGA